MGNPKKKGGTPPHPLYIETSPIGKFDILCFSCIFGASVFKTCTMTIELNPELGVALTPEMDYIDLRERAEAACRSAELLGEHGADIEPVPADKEVAATLTSAYAQNPEKTSKAVTTARAAQMTPASLVEISKYLDEYGRQVVDNAISLRHMVTNRLIEESQNPDPRIRIRALELLGKHSDVGLFTERSEVTVTHQTTDELKARLRKKLQKLIKQDDQPEDAVVIDGDVVDLDSELGLGDTKTEPVPDVYEPEGEFDDDPA